MVLVRGGPGPLECVVTAMARVTAKALGVSAACGSACALRSGLAFFQAREDREEWLWFVRELPAGGTLAPVLAAGR